ncbi:MAG: LD-carboxypeptidase [Betaproteobacteria bacterium]|jgi:muramoyltetrapeptide carboxypeptidase|nr:LD-carboxypeptidase [Rubrivivax sp.]
MTTPTPWLPLRQGALVGVVAPSGPVDPAVLPAVEALYARHGWRARLYPSCRARHPVLPYLAGDDAQRLDDLHAALADDEVAAIHCLRGGYGAMRLLPGIDTALLRAKPKLLMGYSDITALHALWAAEGLPSLHAPMPASDLVRPGREDDEAALVALLQGGLPAGTVLAPELEPGEPVHPGVAEGVLIGGNLSLVAALCGTPWAWNPHRAILFLEDVSESLYRVDRYLVQLQLAGVLRAVAGIVLGSFTESEAPEALLRERLLPLCRETAKPLLGGWPTGHGTPNRPLPLGLRVRLDAGAGTLTLLEPLAAPAQ